MDTQNQTLIYTLGMRPKRVKKQPTASLILILTLFLPLSLPLTLTLRSEV